MPKGTTRVGKQWLIRSDVPVRHLPMYDRLVRLMLLLEELGFKYLPTSPYLDYSVNQSDVQISYLRSRKSPKALAIWRADSWVMYWHGHPDRLVLFARSHTTADDELLHFLHRLFLSDCSRLSWLVEGG